MGDSRAEIKIGFSIYGEDFKADWSINYYPEDGGCGLDRRVREWFETCFQQAREKYDDAMYESEKNRRKREAEEIERREFVRLKEKYEPETGSKLEN